LNSDSSRFIGGLKALAALGFGGISRHHVRIEQSF
jgi:hypothetical protein